MSRLDDLDIHSIGGSVRDVLEHVRERTGMVPAILRVIANSAAATEGIVALQDCLDAGVLDRRLRVRIGLAVSESNRSEYCVAAFAARARAEGLSEEAIRDARRGGTPDRRADAALGLAVALGERPPGPVDHHLVALERVGYTPEEIAEIVANAVLVSSMNYFNRVSSVTSDFPPVDGLESTP